MAAPGPEEKLHGAGALTRRTRRLAFASAELRSDRRLIASATVTKAITPRVPAG